jgi:cbb3-type cytochrome oxidase subunit 3
MENRESLCQQSQQKLKTNIFTSLYILICIITTFSIIANIILLKVLFNISTLTRAVRYILVNIALSIVFYHIGRHLYFLPMVIITTFASTPCAMVMDLDLCTFFRSPSGLFANAMAYCPCALAIERVVNTYFSTKSWSRHFHIYIILLVWAISIALLVNGVHSGYASSTGDLVGSCALGTTSADSLLQYIQQYGLISLEVVSIAVLHIVYRQTKKLYFDSEKRSDQSLTTRIQLKRNMDATKAVLPIMYALIISVILDRGIRFTAKIFITDVNAYSNLSLTVSTLATGLFTCVFPLLCLTIHPGIRNRARVLFPVFKWLDKRHVHPLNTLNEADIYARNLEKLWGIAQKNGREVPLIFSKL